MTETSNLKFELNPMTLRVSYFMQSAVQYLYLMIQVKEPKEAVEQVRKAMSKDFPDLIFEIKFDAELWPPTEDVFEKLAKISVQWPGTTEYYDFQIDLRKDKFSCVSTWVQETEEQIPINIFAVEFVE